ncbi:MAG: pyruvate ferredoxin oxidoreductase alpha subunit [Thermodesulfobacteriota bacterium]|nr:pyruvate ferredoxin oxidoreductase alpha subunit [Thermodesulfobacteriota bacterium]
MTAEKTKIITANEAAAIAARLCRVQVIAAYPITPQTPVTEELAAMVERGELNAEYLTVESEHSAMAAVVGASQVGARVFTATSANGLLYMHEVLHWAAGSRVPVVMACVNRGVGAPWTILNDQQDSISQRDTGWVQLYCRNSQEVLDTIIQAYRIAEQGSLPVMVCYDGFVLSHASTPVEIPPQELVDQFLPPRNDQLSIFSDGPGNLNPLILSEARKDAKGTLKPG